DGIRDFHVTGVQTCALPIFRESGQAAEAGDAAPGQAGDDQLGQQDGQQETTDARRRNVAAQHDEQQRRQQRNDGGQQIDAERGDGATQQQLQAAPPGLERGTQATVDGELRASGLDRAVRQQQHDGAEDQRQVLREVGIGGVDRLVGGVTGGRASGGGQAQRNAHRNQRHQHQAEQATVLRDAALEQFAEAETVALSKL